MLQPYLSWVRWEAEDEVDSGYLNDGDETENMIDLLWYIKTDKSHVLVLNSVIERVSQAGHNVSDIL